MIIQVMGQAGSGKTAFSKLLSQHINAIHLNADEVRADLNSDLDFSHDSRIENARRLGAMARLISGQGRDVIVDFICPTEQTRTAFGKAEIVVWMDRIQTGRYEDTNLLWQTPEKYDIRFEYGLTVQEEVEQIIEMFKLFDWKKPTTLMLGRYQPWHEGHRALYEKAKERTTQVTIGVRNTQGTSEKDPFTFDQVKNYICDDVQDAALGVLLMPNITHIVYGRDVGYKIEQIKMEDDIEAISATSKRKAMGI